MKNVLFLDDNRERLKTARIVYPESDCRLCLVETAADCIEALEQGTWDIVSLDHDLGGQIFQQTDREDCGMEVVRWIIENMPEIPLIQIHSWNLPAAREMYSKLKNSGYVVIRKMFGM